MNYYMSLSCLSIKWNKIDCVDTEKTRRHLTDIAPRHPVELPDEPGADGDVEEDEAPVAGHQQHRQDHQLQPQLRDVPEVQTAAAFLGVQVVALQI